MRIEDVQSLLAVSSHYSGGIDGIIGPKLLAGIEAVERAAVDLYPPDYRTWPVGRRAIAAGQVILHLRNYAPGAIDGYAGHNTENAFAAWRFARLHGRSEVVSRAPAGGYVPHGPSVPKQSEAAAVYGDPETQVPDRLVTVILPFALRLDWALDQTTHKMTVHRGCAEPLRAAMIEVHRHFGMDEMRRLGIDRYAGGHMKRRMRGGTEWSMHAYGCAVDFFAAPNGLRTRCPEALFCGAEYRPFLDIMESHGWLPAIRLWGADAMHFQMARMG